MKMKLQKNLLKKIMEIEKITGTDYEIQNNYIEIEKLLAIIEDLLLELHCLEERFDDYKQIVNDNYRRISVEEQL